MMALMMLLTTPLQTGQILACYRPLALQPPLSGPPDPSPDTVIHAAARSSHGSLLAFLLQMPEERSRMLGHWLPNTAACAEDAMICSASIRPRQQFGDHALTDVSLLGLQGSLHSDGKHKGRAHLPAAGACHAVQDPRGPV